MSEKTDWEHEYLKDTGRDLWSECPERLCEWAALKSNRFINPEDAERIKRRLLDTEDHGFGAFWHEAVHAVFAEILFPEPETT